jgi:hypothetical protein
MNFMVAGCSIHGETAFDYSVYIGHMVEVFLLHLPFLPLQ